MALATVRDLMIAELRDIYSAETQLLRAVHVMASGGATRSLRTALEDHLEQTLEDVVRLKRIVVLLDERARGTTCRGMEGLLEDCEELLDEDGDDTVRDAKSVDDLLSAIAEEEVSITFRGMEMT